MIGRILGANRRSSFKLVLGRSESRIFDVRVPPRSLVSPRDPKREVDNHLDV